MDQDGTARLQSVFGAIADAIMTHSETVRAQEWQVAEAESAGPRFPCKAHIP